MKAASSWLAKGVRVQAPAVTKLLDKIDSPPHPLLRQLVCLPGPAGFPQPSAFSVQESYGRGICPTGPGVEGTYLKLHGEHSMFSQSKNWRKTCYFYIKSNPDAWSQVLDFRGFWRRVCFGLPRGQVRVLEWDGVLGVPLHPGCSGSWKS